jgi:hypothetical protein
VDGVVPGAVYRKAVNQNSRLLILATNNIVTIIPKPWLCLKAPDIDRFNACYDPILTGEVILVLL